MTASTFYRPGYYMVPKPGLSTSAAVFVTPSTLLTFVTQYLMFRNASIALQREAEKPTEED